MHLSQVKKKAQNDLHTKVRELFIGESIMAKNFQAGAPWLPGMTTERLGPVKNNHI